MTSIKELSSLLGTLYSAPQEPEKWQVFLDHLCVLTDTASSYMLAVHPDEGNVTLAGGGLNFNPETLHLYNQHYGANDPYAAPLMANPRVGIIHAEELVSRPDLFRSELYNEILRPNDLEYMTLVSCGSPQEAGIFPLWRSQRQGPMDLESIHLLETLLPHIQTALRLRTKIMDCKASNLFSETALDAMSIAAFLVTAKGRVRHMNQLAAAGLQLGNGLALHHGKLIATDASENAQLESLISAAAPSGRNRPHAAPGGAIRISRSNSQEALQITVIPVPQENHIVDGASSALVFVSDPSLLPKSRTTLMQQLYGFTPAEARVAGQLLNGLDVREAAETLNITFETCRFHLKRVLSKTGTRRQAELMRLMLSLPAHPTRS